MDHINSEYCSNCKGRCCKKSGCDYFINDFEVINKAYLTQVLDTGNVSIVSVLLFDKLPDGKDVCTPFLYLRARNVGRDVVDLYSLKKQCSMLTDTGCMYTPEERPSGGLNLIPNEDYHKCKPDKSIPEEISKWAPYQNLLSKLVKRYSGMSVDERFRKDVEQVFVDVLSENFEGVAKEEIKDILSSIMDLAVQFEEEYKRALNRCGLAYNVLRRK